MPFDSPVVLIPLISRIISCFDLTCLFLSHSLATFAKRQKFDQLNQPQNAVHIHHMRGQRCWSSLVGGR
jgi:hypothetical protein